MTIARGEEQRGVRRLAAELDAARLSLANALPPEVDPEPLVNRALLSLWEQRFRGRLSRPPAQLPQALKALGLKARRRTLPEGCEENLADQWVNKSRTPVPRPETGV